MTSEQVNNMTVSPNAGQEVRGSESKSHPRCQPFSHVEAQRQEPRSSWQTRERKTNADP